MMLFHHVHGNAILLSDDRTSARRSPDHFCNGLVFTDQPIKIKQKLCLELGCVTTWSGGIRIGVTTVDPMTLKSRDLPKYAFPDLTTRVGFWICAVSESLLDTGTRVTVYIDSKGHLQVFINNQHRGSYLSNLPTNRQLWGVFDVYGNTCAAKFVRSEDAPTEIVARGPEAVRAYEEACVTGVKSLFRTRLMLVGQEGVGKTSLRRMLVGQKHQENEESTDGIDLSASCSFSLRDRSAWKLAVQRQTSLTSEDQDTVVRESAEEEYHRAIAENIVHELMYQRRQSQESNLQAASAQRTNSPSKSRGLSPVNKPRSQSPAKMRSPSPNKVHNNNNQNSSNARGRNSRLSSHPSHSSLSCDLSVPPEVLQSVPDRVVQLVQSMLDEQNSTGRVSSARRSIEHPHQNVQLNIWDFAGQAVYYTTHQVFLTSRAVYVIVLNLCHNLQIDDNGAVPKEVSSEGEFSTLGYMDFWMRSIHAHAAENARRSVDQSTLSPPIFIVGTHRNSLHTNPEKRQKRIQEKFRQLETYIRDKPYAKHVVTPFFAVENSQSPDEAVENLRREIEQVSAREPYMGEQRPIQWLRFEHRIEQLVAEGAHYATYDQMKDIAGEEEIVSDAEVKTMLEFYHDQGLVIYYGGATVLDNLLRNTVILDPRWLIDMFKRVIAPKDSRDMNWLLSSWEKLEDCGILEDSLIDYLWSDVLDQKPVLLSLMEKFDLISKRKNSSSLIEDIGCSYYVPVKFKSHPHGESLYISNSSDVVFYLDFNGFLPEGLFHRILTRGVRWSQEAGGQEPQLYKTAARFFVDTEHDVFLEMSPYPYCRVKVIVANVTEKSDDDDKEDPAATPPPDPKACAKVRNFLDSTLSDLRALWMRRVCYRTSVECPCGRLCKLHGNPACQHHACKHFLDLDECLTNKVVLCEHRRIKTTHIKKWFPEPPHLELSRAPVLPGISLKDAHGNIEKQCPDLPVWVKGAAKLLNSSVEEQDWLTLSKQLGYKQVKIEQFNDDLNPALALLSDWIITSGNTALSVDVLLTYLEQMNREDIVEVIQSGQESESEPAQIFLSYQWDSQDDVRALRDRLERAGFTCWMDIGQMGGGDQLYSRIDAGIRSAKVIVACVSPKYTVSHYCSRELSLADLLQKPILPVLLEPVSWPPPGGMALIFAQLVYIDMKGVGGHGGSGVHADLEDKYNEVIQRVSQYATPTMTPRRASPLLIEDAATLATNNSQSSRTAMEDHSSGQSQQGTPLGSGQPITDHHSLRSPHSLARVPGTGLITSTPQPIVEQVHVTKCGVCVIL